MRRSSTVLAATVMALLDGAAGRAEETSCDGELRRVTVDTLRVPQDASCRLRGTRVQGPIVVEAGAALSAKGI